MNNQDVMYATVKLLNGFAQPLLYHIPDAFSSCAIGTIVQVPLRHQKVSAIITHVHTHLAAKPTYTIRSIIAIESFPSDPHYISFLKQVAYYYQIDMVHLIGRINHFLKQKQESELALFAEKDDGNYQLHILTTEQQHIVDTITPTITHPCYSPSLIHGVTGSGKTEVYKHLIVHAHQQRKTTILMLPEVTLALRFEHMLRTCFSSMMPVCGFHSGSTPTEKKYLWHLLVSAEPCLIIGVHLPILLPIANVGLIIIDEEHETGYQEKKHPKINSKEAALFRAHQAAIPIVLGSATPSIATLYNAQKHAWPVFHLHNRFAGTFPTITLVPLLEKKERRSFWITQELEAAIADRLAKKEQTIIFINRRGYSFFVQCGNCSFIFTCTICSVSLTLHEKDHLQCHYCGHEQQLDTHCPQCKKSAHHFLKKGIGTQQVSALLQQLFPKARIARADLDVTRKKKIWANIVDSIEQGKIDIIVGTQTITKGYHFPQVTLVGILWADLNLHFPFYNAAEVTLQKIIQVAGRAGRATDNSTVIIQAMIDHPIFQHTQEVSYLAFYNAEIEKRMAVGYPPDIRLAEIELKGNNEHDIDYDATQLAEFLHTHKAGDTIILGPAKPMVYKIKNTHIRKIYLKDTRLHNLISLFQKINLKSYTSHIYFTPNPLG